LEGQFCGGAECHTHHTTVHDVYIVTVVIWILGLKVSGSWRGLERREGSLKGRGVKKVNKL
jgi:hypothetical protein